MFILTSGSMGINVTVVKEMATGKMYNGKKRKLESSPLKPQARRRERENARNSETPKPPPSDVLLHQGYTSKTNTESTITGDSVLKCINQWGQSHLNCQRSDALLITEQSLSTI